MVPDHQAARFETIRGKTLGCFLLALGIVLGPLSPLQSLHATDAYYQTLLPQLPPVTPAPVNQPGVFDRMKMHFGSRVGRPRKTVIMADKPRQAALAALDNPALGVTMAGYALSAAMDAERKELATCVDLYFEVVAFSWNFLRSDRAEYHAEYESAWQLYHHGLARLLATGQRFGRLDPRSGLRVITPVGPQVIPTSYTGFVWKPSDFGRIELPANAERRKLRRHYSTPGLGVPLVVVRAHGEPERFLNDSTPFVATAVLRPSLAALAGRAPPVGAARSHGPLEFYDPLRVAAAKYHGKDVALAANTSAALEYGIKNLRYRPWQGLVRPGTAEADGEKLFMVEPYQPGKYPLVFVHGFYSSPLIWAEFANEIMARPELRKHIQLMAYSYPTGRPFVESAAVLRRELYAFARQYDPDGRDPGMANIAMLGHSMGGLVSKLIVTKSDDTLWYSIANRPLSEIKVMEEGRDRLRDLFYFEPVPFVRRVVFMGTPHDGAMLASQLAGRYGSSCIRLPREEVLAHSRLVKQNPGVFTREITKRISTSIDMMERGSGLLQAIQTLCPGSHVQLHNIIGTGLPSLLDGCADGVVSVRSAQHPWVSTEKRVHTTHGGLHDTDEAVKEVLCILRRHILEANDPPGVTIPEVVMPEQIIPGLAIPQSVSPECVEFELTDPCPGEMILDDPCPVELCPPEPSLDGPSLDAPCLDAPVVDGPCLDDRSPKPRSVLVAPRADVQRVEAPGSQ